MTLQPGTRVGPYLIGAPLGAGGMGEVFRATDTKLGRDVAIKVVAAGAADAARLARFEREARTLAALNHPWPRPRPHWHCHRTAGGCRTSLTRSAAPAAS